MLVLSRKASERIQIGDSIVVTVVRIAGNVVRLGVEAPKETPVVRQELCVSCPESNLSDFRYPPVTETAEWSRKV
jgi:carbon storage regulator